MPEGRSALHCASMTGNLVVMKVLLEFGADLELAVCPPLAFFSKRTGGRKQGGGEETHII